MDIAFLSKSSRALSEKGCRRNAQAGTSPGSLLPSPAVCGLLLPPGSLLLAEKSIYCFTDASRAFWEQLRDVLTNVCGFVLSAVESVSWLSRTSFRHFSTSSLALSY